MAIVMHPGHAFLQEIIAVAQEGDGAGVCRCLKEIFPTVTA